MNPVANQTIPGATRTAREYIIAANSHHPKRFIISYLLMGLTEIDTNNAAFDDGNDGRDEIARLLRSISERIENGGIRQFNILDVNGNTVGKVHFYS